MTIDQSTRPRYYQGQYLGSEDLTAAVDYGRLQMDRHDLGAHTWGIAMGLQLTEQTSPTGGKSVDMYVQPGYAWDGFGRTIVVLAPYHVPPDMFQALRCGGSSDCAVEVWLAYTESETQSPRPGFGVCDPADQYSRVRESFTLVVGARQPSRQRAPLTIAGRSIAAEGALTAFDPKAPVLFDTSVPYQQFPDAGVVPVWLVPLGFVRWQPNPDPSLPGNFITRTNDDQANNAMFRRTIGVVAGAVHAAEGAIRLKSRENPYSTVKSDDLVWAEGSLRVEGDIRPFGGKLDFRTAAGLSTDSTANDVPLSIARVEDTTRPGTDLRVVLGNKDAGDNRFAVGPMDHGTFVPRFSVKETGDISWGGSTFSADQGGSLELGGNNTTAGVGTPYIDFHFTGLTQDYNTRIWNDANGRLSLVAPTLSISGNVGIGTGTPGAALEIGNGGDALFQGSGENAGDVIFQSGAGLQKGRMWTNPAAGAGLYLSSGDNTPRITVDPNGLIGMGTTAPVERLDVRGNIKLQDGDLFALGGTENLRMLRGNVGANGGVESGSGFTVNKSDIGQYVITFDRPFAFVPSCAVTQINRAPSGAVQTTDNAVINDLTAARVTILTGKQDGSHDDREFSFVVLGPR